MTAALEGIRVVDFSRALAGPWAAMILGDFGADVIKVEEPLHGDTTRGFPPFWNGESTYYMSANRNKRALTLALDTEAGRAIALRLIDRADIAIESFRSGAMEKWGLGWETLRERNPRLVYCAVSAAGRDGPDKDRAGVDLLMQAYAGLMSITGEEGGEPVRTGTSVVDLATGANAAQGILAALYVREYPRFQAAYRALGYSEGYFNDRLVDVIDHLLVTPDLAVPPTLVRPKALYLYADEDLESRSLGQKVLLRIGPANAGLVKSKLRELRRLIMRRDAPPKE